MPIPIFGYMAIAGGLYVLTTPRKPGESMPSMPPDEIATGYGSSDPPAGWVWPLPIIGGYKPEDSDRYQSVETSEHRAHHGVDIMYRRKSKTDKIAEYPPGSEYGSPGYFIPGPHVPVIAVRSGTVWSAGKASGGMHVVIDHDEPNLVTYYQHLQKLFVEETEKGASRQRVRAGQIIGYVGRNPEGYNLAHLHFEVWDSRVGKVGSQNHVPPMFYLDRASYLELTKASV